MFQAIRRLMRPRWPVSREWAPGPQRVVLLASGEQTRWHGVGRKQLAPVDGEPVMLRTLRLVGRHLDTRPLVVTQCEEIARAVAGQADVLALPPEQRRWAVETALSSSAAWGESTWILLGDVYWTDSAIERVMRINRSNPPQYFISTGYKTSEKVLGFWRRRRARRSGDKRWDEILGLWFGANHRGLIADCLYHAVLAAQQGGRGKLWESYRSLCGFRLERHCLESRHRMDIVDGSMDFDTLEEYLAFVESDARHAA
jgi:MobA-like NTP transferase domain